jgi:hypothetical protein
MNHCRFALLPLDRRQAVVAACIGSREQRPLHQHRQRKVHDHGVDRLVRVVRHAAAAPQQQARGQAQQHQQDCELATRASPRFIRAVDAAQSRRDQRATSKQHGDPFVSLIFKTRAGSPATVQRSQLFSSTPEVNHDVS